MLSLLCCPSVPSACPPGTAAHPAALPGESQDLLPCFGTKHSTQGFFLSRSSPVGSSQRRSCSRDPCNAAKGQTVALQHRLSSPAAVDASERAAHPQSSAPLASSFTLLLVLHPFSLGTTLCVDLNRSRPPLV